GRVAQRAPQQQLAAQVGAIRRRHRRGARPIEPLECIGGVAVPIRLHVIIGERLQYHAETRRVGDRIETRYQRLEIPDRLRVLVLLVGDYAAHVIERRRRRARARARSRQPPRERDVPVLGEQPVRPGGRIERRLRTTNGRRVADRSGARARPACAEERTEQRGDRNHRRRSTSPTHRDHAKPRTENDSSCLTREPWSARRTRRQEKNRPASSRCQRAPSTPTATMSALRQRDRARRCASAHAREPNAAPLDIREKRAHVLPTPGRRRHDVVSRQRPFAHGSHRVRRAGAAGHARPADPEDAVARADARLGSRAPNSGALARSPPGWARLDLPGRRAPRTARLGIHVLAYDREQSAGEVLHDYRCRPARHGAGARELEAIRRRGHARRGGYVRVTVWDRMKMFLTRGRESLHRHRIMMDLDDELRTHLEMETAYNMTRGMPPADAARAARIAIGGVETVREQVGDARGFSIIDNLVRDIRFAFRQLRRTPAFTASIAATLAIGIGATTAIFAVLDSVVLRPLPYPDANRMVGVWWSLPGMGFPLAPQSVSTYFAIKRLATSFDGIGVVDRTAVNVVTRAGDEHAERLNGAAASASLFSLLGPRFIAGRPYTAAEDVPNATPVVVISEGFWRRHYGGDRTVIGQQLIVDGQSRTIVGVTASGFHFPDEGTQLWTPIELDSATAYGGPFAHQAFARLRPGVTIDDARREIARLMPRMGELYPDIAPSMALAEFLRQAHAGVVVHPMRDDVVGGFGTVAIIAAAAGVLLFAIALANAASLLLTRAEGRQRELALRVVLGAGTRRVLAQFVA